MIRELTEQGLRQQVTGRTFWLGFCAIVMPLGCLAGCMQNPNLANPFSTQPNGFAQVPTGTPAQQVAQLDQWRRQATEEADRLRSQVDRLTQQNSTLLAQVNNAKQHAQLQDEHLAGVSQRLKDTTTELAGMRGQGGDKVQNLASLDRLNQEKERQLAAARQTVQRLDGELKRFRIDLQNARSELVRAQAEKADAQRTAENLMAASRHRGGATIDANINLAMPNINAPGVTAQRDGDVIRVRMTADQVFEPGTVRMRTGAANVVRNVATELARTYPSQRIGVEGHAAGGMALGGTWRNEHHLSSAQAMAIYEFLTAQSLFSPNQLHVVGHGANHPIYSTATTSGRRANQRVELVIYPETVGR